MDSNSVNIADCIRGFKFTLVTFLLAAMSACGGGGSGSPSTPQVSPPSNLSYSSPQTFTAGSAITALNPTVTGSVTGYSVTPALPSGLSLNTVSGQITGTPTAATTSTNIVTATNSAGSTSFSLSITILPAAPTGLSYMSPITTVVGLPIADLDPTVVGTVASYTVTPALPAGISLNATTGRISGTPTVVASASNYTVTAQNPGGQVSTNLNLAVVIPAPSSLSYPAPPQFTAGVAIAPLNATVTGTVTLFTVLPLLPTGLSINSTTGQISGTPTIAAAQRLYTVMASNGTGTTSFSFNITVAIAPPSGLSYPSPQSYAVGNAITPINPSVTGTVTSYTVSPSLPAGLSLNQTSGQISGTPTALQSAVNYTVTAQNPGGQTTATISIAVVPPPQAQTISFATPGPIVLAPGSTTTNTASGGAGTGAITYSSSNTLAATVDASTGTVTALGIGATTITATKAADANYLQAQATYTLNSQTATTLSAFIGGSSTEVYLPQSANGLQFGRARVADCSPGATVLTCTGGELGSYTAAAISDTRATLATPAYYALVNGSTVGTPVDVRANRFSGRIGHQVVRFNNRYFVIGGGEPIYPSPGSTISYTPKADVWSSDDGKSWKLETANGGFGARWFHQAVVYNNRIWILSGADIPAQSPLPWYADAWSSADGVTWTQESTNLMLPWWSTTINAFVQAGELRVISGGRVYGYSDASHIFVKKSSGATIDLTGSSGGRSGASLAFYNNLWWYIGGRTETPINTPIVGNTMNDVWSSPDGLTWTLVSANGVAPFASRYRHSSFAIGGKLWVMGGIPSTNGVDGTVPADAWSTTDGVTWTNESIDAVGRGYLMATVQETGKATVFGGIQVTFSNNVMQTTDGSNWRELSNNAQFSARFTKAISFNGQMWAIGGSATDGRVADRHTNEIWRSTDGVNWLKVTPSGAIFSARESQAMTVHNGRLWLSGGWANTLPSLGPQVRYNDVWSTADGVNWRQDTASAAFSARVGHSMFSFNNKIWVAAGNSSSGYLNDVWSSSDGVTWTNETAAAAFAPRTSGGITAFNNALWLIDGDNGSSAFDDVWKSTDGIAWVQQSPGARFSTRTRHGTQVFNGRLYIIAGMTPATSGAPTYYNDVWSSADGITWRQDVANAPFAPRSLAQAVAHNNDLWLIGGLGANALSNEVWRSSDAVNWRVSFSRDIALP